jgi:hypothetical protein
MAAVGDAGATARARGVGSTRTLGFDGLRGAGAATGLTAAGWGETGLVTSVFRGGVAARLDLAVAGLAAFEPGGLTALAPFGFVTGCAGLAAGREVCREVWLAPPTGWALAIAGFEPAFFRTPG